MITKKTLYNQLNKLLQKTKTMECIDYTWHTNSASIDLYDIISEKGEKEKLFFQEVDWLNDNLKKYYQTELKKFYYEYEIGAQARIFIFW